MKTTEGSYRLAVAARYWHSVHIILKAQIRPVEYMEPVGHLLGMVAELALKAFLLDAGYTEKQLGATKVGHDLGVCLGLCIGHGLRLSESEAVCILILGVAHQKHFHRYGPNFDHGTASSILLAKEEEALMHLAKLIDRVGMNSDLLRKRHQHPRRFEWPDAQPVFDYIDMRRFEEIKAQIDSQARAASAIADKQK